MSIRWRPPMSALGSCRRAGELGEGLAWVAKLARRAERIALSLLLAGAVLFGGLAPAASASEEMCDDEPPVLVRTPAGNPVLVNNFLSAARSHREELRDAVVTGSAVAAGEGRSRVTITVFVEKDDGEDFDVKVRSVVKRFKLEATGEGKAGRAITVSFVVPLP